MNKFAETLEDRPKVVAVDDRLRLGEGLVSLRSRASSLWSSLDGTGRPDTGLAYYVLLSCVIGLTAIGLTMVLSASAVEQITKDLDPTSLFRKQAMWAAGGIVLMFAASRLPVPFLKKLAWPAYLLALGLLIAVIFTPLGVDVKGNRNWLRIGGFQMQPSEPAKLAIALWSAGLLARKRQHLGNWKETAIPVLGLGGLLIALVLLGKDLGTSMILSIVLAASLWAAGLPKRVFAWIGVAIAVVGAVMALSSGNRTSRLAAWLGTNCDTGLCDQSNAAITGLARGGWLGVGLGQSQIKWSWLPEAHNDFVFAIVGEELGWLGTTLIILFFAIFTLVAVRVVLRYDDVFIRVVGFCIIIWISLQAFVNIAMVVGLLPVIGVPLPFISYGGSALTFTLLAVGILLSFARHTKPRKAAKRTIGKAAAGGSTSLRARLTERTSSSS